MTRTLLRSAAILSLSGLALAACGGEAEMAETETVPVVTPAPTAEMMPAGDPNTLVPDVQTVLSSAESAGGVTNIDVATAAPILQRIQASLNATNAAPLQEMANTIGTLLQQLQGPNTPGGDIGRTLDTLATQVNNYAPQAPAEVQGALQTLGTALQNAAQNLMGGM